MLIVRAVTQQVIPTSQPSWWLEDVDLTWKTIIFNVVGNYSEVNRECLLNSNSVIEFGGKKQNAELQFEFQTINVYNLQ